MSDDVAFFDAHCVLGRHAHWRAPQPRTVPEVLAVLDRFGIAQALVTDSVAREVDPASGNSALARAVAGEPRLLPAWVLLPGATAETPSPGRLLDDMRGAGVRAAFLCPGTYGHGLDDWEVDETLGALADARVPVFLDGERGFPGWDYAYTIDSLDVAAAVRMARRHPDLPVVLTAFRFRDAHRQVCRAMQAVPNLYMELSAWWFYKNVELLVELVGPERLLFGTRLPVHDPAAAKATVQFADIAPDAIRLIAGDNLRRLLSWDGELPAAHADATRATQDGTFHRAALADGLPEGETIADCHAHVGRSSTYHVPRWTPAELVREMDRLGVETSCVFSFGGGGRDDEANDLVLEAQQQWPDRFLAFAFPGVCRTAGDYEAELRRCIDAGFRGIKTYTEDPELLRIACGVADRERLLILNHSWGRPEQLLSLAKQHPNAVLITGHTGRGYVGVWREVPNVYMCTCPLIAFGATEWYVQHYGADRLLFGSDMSDLPHAWGFGPVLYADISDADKRAILGGNLRRLLHTHSRPRGGR
jgi:predicted TIM-barrel fold metal-dependent hydrolase